ncbi:MAG: long-chain fatty acid--CoA ligase [Candidatus Hermodarchaeota archaeon]
MSKPYHKKYPEGVKKTLEYPNIPLFKYLDDAVKEFPDHEAVILEGSSFSGVHTLTYSELGDRTDRLAAFLHQKGVKKGDRVALFLPNFPDFVIGYYGILKSGATAVLINFQYETEELEMLLKDSGAKAIITMDLPKANKWCYKKVLDVRNNVPGLELVIVGSVKPYLGSLKRLIGGALGMITKKDPQDTYLAEVYEQVDPANRPEVAIDNKEDVATLIYTGGTTGTPKGAMLTHRNLVSNVMQCLEWTGSEERGKDSIMGSLPFYHSFGMTTAMNISIALGGRLILMPDPRVRGFLEMLELLSKYQCTYFCAVPTIYARLLARPELPEYDISNLRACISGAAPLPLEVMKQFEAVSGGNLVEGYGLTETSPVATGNPLVAAPGLDAPLKKEGSIGIPFPDTDVKIVDVETGEKELPQGEEGEIAIKGPQVMKGYWGMPEETKLVMKGDYFLTGDIGKMDEDGYFFITDRKKDMLILSGFKAYPREIEEVLYEHPAVALAAVIGVPDERHGEAVKAFIVLKEGETATEEDIKKFCEGKLTKYKIPRDVEFREELPLTEIGKVLRRVLKEEEQAKGN